MRSLMRKPKGATFRKAATEAATMAVTAQRQPVWIHTSTKTEGSAAASSQPELRGRLPSGPGSTSLRSPLTPEEGVPALRVTILAAQRVRPRLIQDRRNLGQTAGRIANLPAPRPLPETLPQCAAHIFEMKAREGLHPFPIGTMCTPAATHWQSTLRNTSGSKRRRETTA